MTLRRLGPSGAAAPAAGRSIRWAAVGRSSLRSERKFYGYWVSTSLLAAGMVFAGIQELRHAPELLEAARGLGYPDYLLTLLGAAKLSGAPLLLIQRWRHLKEWVYAGFSFDFGGAIFSHTMSGDTLLQTLPAISCAALLAFSYWCYRTRAPGSSGLDPA